MKIRHPLGLRGRLILLLLTAFAALAYVPVWRFVHDRDDRTNAAGAELLAQTRLMAARQESLLERADAILNSLLVSPELLPGGSTEACARFLAARLKQVSTFSQIGKMQPNGDVVCTAVPGTGSVNGADRPWFLQTLQAREMVVSEVVTSRTLGTPAITLAKAARDAGGRVTSVLYLSLGLDWLEQELSKAHLPEGARLAVVDGRGAVALRYPDWEAWTGKSVAHLPVVQHILAAGAEGTLEGTGLGGERLLFAHAPLLTAASGSYYLLLALPKEVLEAPARRDALLDLSAVLAVLLVTMGWVVVGGNRLLLRPLLALSRTGTRIKAGDLGARSGLRHGDDEIGRLATILDETAAVIEARDTERKVAEKALRASVEQLNQAQHLGLMGNTHIDIQTGKTDWSNETYRIFGVSRETFVPTMDNCSSMVHPDDQVTADAMLEQTRQGINPGPAEYRIIRPDGEVRHILRESEVVRNEAGDPLYVNSTLQDITERRQIEEQLRQAQKMEAIGNLTGGMAHDFNNLLGIIIGNLDLLRDRQSGDSDADEFSREALEAALRGADLTRRLLAFARRQPLQPARTDVNELIAGIVKLLERTLGEQIRITLDLDPRTWPVIVDPAQLESSLTNLATNARDAMPGGGGLTIATGNRSLDADYTSLHAEVAPGDYAMIAVSDTGTGMSPEVVSHIFEPFYTTKEQGKGTGLGLSMVFGFIKQSGGHINVYSEARIGTTFRLFLRRADDGLEAGGAVVPAAFVRGSGETVLAVEDNASLRRVVVRQLTELGYRVLEAENAATALQVLESEPVDLLFTDVVMPGGTSGYELAGTALARWPAIKVVLTSGFPEQKITGNAEAPHLRLLSKPYRRDDLGRVIREALDS